MNIEKRISQLEAVTPTEPAMTSLREIYEWESQEGKKELDELYNPDRYESE